MQNTVGSNDCNINIEEDSNYQIENTSKLNTDEKRTYISKLEHKIKEQAKRLTELTKYKFICEKRILQLNPNEQLPLISISNITESSNQIDSNNSNYDALYEKYKQLLASYNEMFNENNQKYETLKSQNNNYRKQLVLSQALVNSLKSEIEQMNTLNLPQQQQQECMRDINDDSGSNNVSQLKKENKILFEQNVNLKTKIMSLKEQIQSLNYNMGKYSSLLEEAEHKITKNYDVNSETAKQLKSLSNLSDTQRYEIQQYENKFTQFEAYVNNIKTYLTNLHKHYSEHIHNNITMINNNNHSNNTFSQTFKSKINDINTLLTSINHYDKYSLDLNDTNIIESVFDYMNILNNELKCLHAYNEQCSQKQNVMKSLEHELQHNNTMNKEMSVNMNKLQMELSVVHNENRQLKLAIDELKMKNYDLDKDRSCYLYKVQELEKQKNVLMELSIRVIQICNKNEHYLKLYQEAIWHYKQIDKLEDEKEKINLNIRQLNINDSNTINNVSGNNTITNNCEITHMMQNEKHTLMYLLDDIENKIQERKCKINVILQTFDAYHY
jgi:chromosome segregation ATPase